MRLNLLRRNLVDKCDTGSSFFEYLKSGEVISTNVLSFLNIRGK